MNEIKKGMTEQEIEDYVEWTLNQLTLKEKVSQMRGNGLISKIMMDRGFGKRAYDAAGLKRFGIPPFKFTDGPRGVIIPGSTCFPVSMARGATWDINLEERVGDVIGKEVRAHDGNLFGGVCINLLRHPAWGRAQETYGEDPFLLGEFGAALTRGVQKHNVMATAKHFVANSIEFSRFRVNVTMDERTLREVYLPQFKRCVEEGCATIMSAYNKFRGKFCGHNDYLLRDILKKDWKFQGFVHSDWMRGVKDTVGGVTGGLDVEMPRVKYFRFTKIRRALEEGKISEVMIDEAARRVMKTILKFVTREDPQIYNQDLIGCSPHHQLALEVAEKSMVLLKNDNNILPLKKNNINKLAIYGKYAKFKNTGDHGSSNVSIKREEVITPLKGIQNYLGNSIDLIYNDGTDIASIKSTAKEVDAAIVVVGLSYTDEGEYIIEYRVGGDRVNLSLHDEDIELIKAVSAENHNCIVVLIGGSAITMEEWRDQVPAIIMAWYSGQEGGNALANIIFGDVNPSGKLPFTIPKDPKNLPFFDKDADEIEYGYYHGYTLFEKEGYDSAFAFGFGLSYTTFNFENLKVEIKEDKVIATLDVQNIGKVAGEEVVQLYVGFENSQIDRPVKLLRGFSRVFLEPNDVKNVKFVVPRKDLSWYNPQSQSWEIEQIKYTIYAGKSSKAEDLLTTQFIL